MFHPGTPPLIEGRNSGQPRREIEYVENSIQHVRLYRAGFALFEPGKNRARNLGNPGKLGLCQALGRSPISDENAEFHRKHVCTLK